MVAGASGVDVALLVVAADDSVMPQTREHLAVLELLGVRHGVIAITKCDLADDEQLELVDLEVAELVEPTCLAQAPVIRVSTASGLGVDEAPAGTGRCRAPFAASTDRPIRGSGCRSTARFRSAGQGAVVTGTVWRGTARVGDTLHLLPEATPVRIRRLQSQGADVETVRRASGRPSTWPASRRRRFAAATSWPRRTPSSRLAVCWSACGSCPTPGMRCDTGSRCGCTSGPIRPRRRC